jgi:flagellar hook-length control protein FliK
MTITPTAPVPAAPVPGSADGPTDPTVAGAFLTLVQQALADALGGAPATPGTSATADQPEADDPPATDAEDPATTAAANGLTAVIAPQLPVVLAIPTTAASSSPVVGDVTGSAAAQPDGGSASALATGATAELATPVTGARPSSGDASDRQDPTSAGSGEVAAGTSDSGPTTAPTTTPTPAPAAAASPGTSTPLAVSGAAPALVSAPAPAGPAPTQQITGQVFPEVSNLVARGDGTHRITLTLKPEALGEVRVVLTVRDGAVHVRLAAGHEAQRALLEGSSELTRLLERAGASDTRIVVRDLAAPTTSSASTHDPGTSPGAEPSAGGNRPHDQHAGTRADQPATDGTHDSTRPGRGATGANPPRSNEPVTRTRTAGVDVTI